MALPALSSHLTPDQILTRLEQAARRGKLPGFSCGAGHGDREAPLFTITDFGTPFESVLEVRAEKNAAAAGTRLRLRSRLKPLFPWIFALSLVVTVWPGVWLTDSLVRTYFSGYDIRTWIWYLPLTAPFCPWAFWKAVKRSRGSAAADLADLIPRIAAEIETPEPPGAPAVASA